MNYNSIIASLAQATEKVQGWANQGFVPSIEKDSVLAILRSTYDELAGGEIVSCTEEPKPQVAEKPVANENSTSIEDIKKFIENNKKEIIAEISALKETITVNNDNETIMFNQIDSIKKIVADKNNDDKILKEIADLKESISSKPVVTAEEPKPEVEKKDEPASNVKVDINPPVLGFYSLPENLRMNIIHDLFDGDTAKAEIAVNKMCSLKSVEEMLIYIEEHFSWNPDSATAMALISNISKKF